MEHETQPDNRILVTGDELCQRECCRQALACYGYQVDMAEVAAHSA